VSNVVRNGGVCFDILVLRRKRIGLWSILRVVTILGFRVRDFSRWTLSNVRSTIHLAPGESIIDGIIVDRWFLRIT